MSRTFTIGTKPYDEFKLYRRRTVTIEPGLTVLTGCNGAGKTTLINILKDKLKELKIPTYIYDNVHDGGTYAASEALFLDDLSTTVTLMLSSEGERILHNIGTTAYKLGAFIRRNKAENELWIFFDAIDSGYSIDNIIETKEYLFSVILEDCRCKGIEVYIIVSANSYEMASGEQCLDVWSGNYMTFKDYDEYRKYILKTRVQKNKRYKD